MAALNYVKSVLPRAVHIKVHPQPQNIRETRTILRVLKDFGEVDSFRSLRNDPVAPAPNVILAVFRSAESAARLIDEAPLQFDVPPPVQQADGLRGLPGSRTSDSTQTRAETSTAGSGEGNSETAKPRQFHLTARPSKFDHQAHIQRQEYYWGFRYNQSSTQLALARSMPNEAGALSNISLQQRQIPTRVVKKLMDEITSRKSLRQLAEDSSRGISSFYRNPGGKTRKEASMNNEYPEQFSEEASGESISTADFTNNNTTGQYSN